MSRSPLPLGTWGKISSWVAATDANGKAVKYMSQAKFRDHDGVVRPVSAYGRTKTASERDLLKKLQDRAKTNQSGDLTALHKVNHLWSRGPGQQGVVGDVLEVGSAGSVAGLRRPALHVAE
jgi:hypothetical protein